MTNFLAQATRPNQIRLGETQPAGVKVTTEPSTIITNVIAIIFGIAILAVLFMLVWGAFEWIISGGDKEKVGVARKRITNALIGLVLLALAFVILTVLGEILNFNILGPLIVPSIGQPVTKAP